MKLIIGLGNPDKQYQKTWHNLGFLTLDYFQQEYDFGNFKLENKFKSQISTGNIDGDKIILAKPQTYMNNSGQAVGLIIKYFKTNLKDIIVVHDDIDLLLGKIRITTDSSAGGHNGVKSIIQNLKTQSFVRIKIGVKTNRLAKVNPANYVLEKYNILQIENNKEGYK